MTSLTSRPLSQSSTAGLRIFVVGATGTIGRATLGPLREAGHDVTVFLRHPQGDDQLQNINALRHAWPDLNVRFGDVTSEISVREDGFAGDQFDAVLSCLGSRTGHPDDAQAIDYQANLNVLNVARSRHVSHFVFLSAICVQKPRVAFQFAKRAFEQSLISSDLDYSIVRPTAFFKSLSGQIARVQAGRPFLIFGHGRLTACKPISDRDLGRYLADCLTDPTKRNRILPIGGPGAPITPLDQAQFLFHALDRKPSIRSIPLAMMRLIVGGLSLAARVSKQAAGRAELARIGFYYATESMLLWNETSGAYDADATPSTGSDTLFEHYRALLSGNATHERGDHSVF